MIPWGTRGIRRTFAAADVAAQTDKAMLDLPCFWPEDWVKAEQHYSIRDEAGNISLLEYVSPGVYHPHIYFSARGREALDIAKEMLHWAFIMTPAEVMIGETPILAKNAWWLVRQLGFKPQGLAASEWGPLRLSRLTKQQFLSSITESTNSSQPAPTATSGEPAG